MNSQRRASIHNIDKSFIAGILMIIVFLIALGSSGSIFFMGEDMVGGLDEWFRDDFGALQACGILLLVFGIISLIGSVCAIKHVSWPMALIASILGIFTIGPYYLGSILSVAALLLIIMSKDEFRIGGRSDSFAPPTAKNRWY